MPAEFFCSIGSFLGETFGIERALLLEKNPHKSSPTLRYVCSIGEPLGMTHGAELSFATLPTHPLINCDALDFVDEYLIPSTMPQLNELASCIHYFPLVEQNSEQLLGCILLFSSAVTKQVDCFTSFMSLSCRQISTELRRKNTTAEIENLLRQEIEFRRQTERKLLESMRQVESSTRLKSVFLANMSHEIRTPLNGIIGIAEVLQKSPLSSSQARQLDIIKRSSDTLLALINDILDFSRLEAGQINLEKEPFDLRQLVRETLEAVEAKFAIKGLHLLQDYPLHVPSHFRGDHLRIRQLLLNLVGNAEKFTQKGHARVVVNYDATTQQLSIDVEDTGIGIPPSKLQIIFERFAQLTNVVDHRVGGTGLGLAICKSIVTLMGGSISVESEVGRGSTFHIKLPLELSANKEERAPTHFIAQNPVPRVTVLHPYPLQGQLICKTLEALHFSPQMLSPTAITFGSVLKSMRADRDSIDVLVVQSDLLMAKENQRLLANFVSDHTKLLVINRVSWEVNLGEKLAKRVNLFIETPINWIGLMRAMAAMGLGTIKEPSTPSLGESLAPATRPFTDSYTVLVAEDNPINQIVIREMLRALHIKCVMTNDGLEAVSAFRKQNFDAIILDCEMPRLDGYGAAEEIGRMSHLERKPPIIALTAHAMAGEKEKCLNFGFDYFLSKPVTLQVLQNTLQMAFTSLPTCVDALQ